MKKELATLAGGCFWCLEAVFKRIEADYREFAKDAHLTTLQARFELVERVIVGALVRRVYEALLL